MKKKFRITGCLLIFLLGFLVPVISSLILMSSPLIAGDELFLTGILRSVDPKSNTVVVDVLSQSCPGPRRFSVGNARVLQGREGGKVSFSINSSSCNGNVIYRITSPIMRNGG